MRWWEICLSALHSLRSNPVRSFLTSFGVLVGVTAVVVLVGVVAGVGGFVEQQFESMLSARVFEVSRHNPGFHDFESMTRSRSWPALTSDDAESLEEYMGSAEAVAWSSSGSGSVVYGGSSASDVMIQGVSPSTEVVSGSDVASGRFFTWAEDEARSRVCILGAGLAEVLSFTSADIGSAVTVDGHRFTVTGIGEESGSMFGMGLDNEITVPFKTFQSLFSRPDGDVRITVLPRTEVTMEACGEEAASILRRVRGLSADDEDNFYIITQESALSSIDELLSTVAAVTIGIAAISLLVGGIGIMNITLVSVTERTREIGTRRAIGARKSDIVLQFLAEAVIVSVNGGIAGLLLGVAVITAVNRLTPLPAVVSGWSVAVAMGFSVLVGLLFGVFPAWKAAELVPIEALRYE